MKLFIAISILAFGSLSLVAQQKAKQDRSTPNRKSNLECIGERCILVRVDGVSNDFPGDVYTGRLASEPNRRNVRVSSTTQTYQLTCNIELQNCTVPLIGSDWQLLMKHREKPEYLNDHQGEFPHQGVEVFLKSVDNTRGPYWLVSEMPLLKSSTFMRSLSECKAKEQGLNENDCTRWMARKAQLFGRKCPTAGGQDACHSFEELLNATDPDLLDMLARLEHVYVCFRPREDTFFTVWFGEPNERDWRRPTEDEQKTLNVSASSLMQFGSLGLDYYKEGVQDNRLGLSGVSIWKYTPLTPDVSPSSLARLATSSDAKLERLVGQPTIRLDGTGIAVTETYKNRIDEEVIHSLTLQRSTGRFSESYEKKASGESLLDYSGQCFVVPSALKE